MQGETATQGGHAEFHHEDPFTSAVGHVIQWVLAGFIVLMFLNAIVLAFQSGKRESALGEIRAKGLPASREMPVEVRHRKDADVVESKVDDGHLGGGPFP